MNAHPGIRHNQPVTAITDALSPQCDHDLRPGKAGTQYSLINKGLQRARICHRMAAQNVTKTAPKWEFKPKIELKSLFRHTLHVSPYSSILYAKQGRGGGSTTLHITPRVNSVEFRPS